MGTVLDADRHAASRLTVANRVVEQVVDEFGQASRVATHRYVLVAALETEVDVLAISLGDPVHRDVEGEA